MGMNDCRYCPTGHHNVTAVDAHIRPVKVWVFLKDSKIDMRVLCAVKADRGSDLCHSSLWSKRFPSGYRGCSSSSHGNKSTQTFTWLKTSPISHTSCNWAADVCWWTHEVAWSNNQQDPRKLRARRYQADKRAHLNAHYRVLSMIVALRSF